MNPTAPPALIRDAMPADLRAITAIYAEAVRTGTGTFETTPPTEAEMGRRLDAIDALGLPRLVAELDGDVVGYAYAGPFRHRPGYRHTVEDSIYLAPHAAGRGIGKALLDPLIARCQLLGLRQVLAVIGDAENTASVRLHASCGFEMAGTLTSVGWKFGRWLDVIFMQRALGGGATTVPDAPGLPLDR